MAAKSAPEMSVVIPTVSPWNQVAPMLRMVLISLAAVDGELVLASGAQHAPAELAGFERVRLLHLPGGDVFALRAAGLGAAIGEIVAVTEDHCELPEDWCGRVRALFAADPALTVLGGAIINGSSASAADRANFRMTFARYAPDALLAPNPNISSVAVRRRLLPPKPEPGWFEYVLLPNSAKAAGTTMRADLICTHVQSHGVIRTPIVHFHNGRVAGAYCAKFGLADAANRPLRAAIRGMRSHLRATRRALSANRVGGLALWPVRMLAIAHGIGFVIGVRRGPGTSARHLV